MIIKDSEARSDIYTGSESHDHPPDLSPSSPLQYIIRYESSIMCWLIGGYRFQFRKFDRQINNTRFSAIFNICSICIYIWQLFFTLRLWNIMIFGGVIGRFWILIIFGWAVEWGERLTGEPGYSLGCQAVRQLPLYVASVGLRLLPPASRSNPTFWTLSQHRLHIN